MVASKPETALPKTKVSKERLPPSDVEKQRAKRKAAPTNSTPAADASKREALFKHRDKDKDGKLSYNEFIVKPDRDNERFKNAFNQKDADEDGYLTLVEYTQ